MIKVAEVVNPKTLLVVFTDRKAALVPVQTLYSTAVEVTELCHADDQEDALATEA